MRIIRRHITAALALLAVPALAQYTEPLSLEDCIKPQKRPVTLRQMQWIPTPAAAKPSTVQERFAYVQTFKSGDYLLAQTPRVSLADTLLRSTDLDPKSRALPQLRFIEEKKLLARKGADLILIDLSGAKPQTTVVSSLPAEAENDDLHVGTQRMAYTLGSNLYAIDKKDVRTISTDGTKDLVYGQAVHQREFGIVKGTFWSPDGGKLAFYKMDQSMVTEYPIVELGTKPAKARLIKYPMAGQKSHHVTIGVYNWATQKTIYLQTAGDPEQYLTNITWSPDGASVYVAVLNRDQNHMQLQRFNASTGALEKLLFEERHPKYVEPEHGPYFLNSMAGHFIWMSERDGHNHLYLYTTEGKLVTQLTKGDFEVLDILEQTTQGKQTRIWYSRTGNDGLDRHVGSVTFDAKGAGLGQVQLGNWTALSSGLHSGKPSPSGRYLLDSWSDSATPYKAAVWDLNLRIAAPYPIYSSANPLAQHGLAAPKLIKLKAADGTTLNGRLVLPAKMEDGKKYPVLVYVYGGPHAQLVTNSWQYGADLWMQHWAQEGYVVFTLDGRGSANRGLNFENATHRQLGTVEMQDQLQGVKYLKSLPYIDSTRMGVYGWSFGGFMATSLMTRYPDVFKAGCAGGPVIDWSMYEVMYTERYMDTPEQNPAGYANNSLLNHARSLKGKMMFIHGTSDDVVLWQHSQEMAKQLIKDKKLFEYMLYPGHPHNVVGTDRAHLFRTIKAYFDRSL